MEYRYYLNEEGFSNQYPPTDYKIMCQHHYDDNKNPKIYFLKDDAIINLKSDKYNFFGTGVEELVNQIRRQYNLEILLNDIRN